MAERTRRVVPRAAAHCLAVLIAGHVGAAVMPTEAPAQDGRPTAFRRLPSDDPGILRSEVDFSIGGQDLRDEIAARASVTVGQIRAALANTTSLSYRGVHGPQVEYASKDGRVYLWYPGNTIILAGRWQPRRLVIEYYEHGKLIKRFENSEVCFQYGENTYNPATGHVGGGFECQTFATFKRHMGETRRGDVLRLRGRVAVPFVLPKERMTFEALDARVKG